MVNLENKNDISKFSAKIILKSNRKELLMSKLLYTSDNQWEIIEPHLPKQKSTGRPALKSHIVFNAIFWVLDCEVAIHSQRIWKLEQYLS